MYDHIAVQTSKEYDAIVIGSGITGGWAAKELTEKGLKTLVLERGRPITHGKDYITEHKGAWEFKFHGRGDRKLFEAEYPIQSRSGPVREDNVHFFINDKEHPYVQVKPFTWVQGNQVGGRSLTWGRQSYRWSDLDYEANLKEGIGVDWPIRYKDIAPWYNYVEDFIGVSGQAEGLSQLPDGHFLPPMEMTCAEKHVKEAVERTFPERTMTIGRTAILTQPHNGRGACHYCGPCSRGCSVGAYFSSLSSTLPAAEATGNLTMRPFSLVHSLIYDEEKDRVTGVRVVDYNTKEVLEFFGRLVFLNASTLGSTRILLNSKSPRFPNGLANSSGALGHYLMDHHFRVGARGTVPGFEDKYYHGVRPNGIYIPRFRNIDKKTKMADFVRGYGFQGGAGRESWGRGISMPGLGADLKQALHEPGPWRMGLTAFGEMLPQYENFVELDPGKKDAWGIPLLRIDCGYSDNEMAMRKDMAATAAEMLEAAGCTDVEPYDNFTEGGVGAEPGLGIHEMGTARMGRDPKTSVLNAHNQAHDVPNLFVTDGACMTSTACQNPSLSYMALTARAVDYAASEMKNGNI